MELCREGIKVSQGADVFFQSPPLQTQRHQCRQKMRGWVAAQGKYEVKVVMVTGTEGLGQNSSPRLSTSYNSSCPSLSSPSVSSSMSCTSCSREKANCEGLPAFRHTFLNVWSNDRWCRSYRKAPNVGSGNAHVHPEAWGEARWRARTAADSFGR